MPYDHRNQTSCYADDRDHPAIQAELAGGVPGRGGGFGCELADGLRVVLFVPEGCAVTQYSKGRSFEHYVKAKLEKEGWWVCRSAGSKGRADLVAIRCDVVSGNFNLTTTRLIQCKSGKERISGKEKQELIDLANELNVSAAVAFKDKSGRVVVQTVTQ